MNVNLKKKIPYVNLSAQYKKEKKELLPIIDKVFSSGSYILGKQVEELENTIAKFIGVKYCVTLNSGTDALLLGLHGIGVGSGDEVITQPNSFIASASVIAHLGAKPVFVDVLEDQSIDFNQIEKKINNRTKAIMPVHLTGRVGEFDEIKTIRKYLKGKIIFFDIGYNLGFETNKIRKIFSNKLINNYFSQYVLLHNVERAVNRQPEDSLAES